MFKIVPSIHRSYFFETKEEAEKFRQAICDAPIEEMTEEETRNWRNRIEDSTK